MLKILVFSLAVVRLFLHCLSQLLMALPKSLKSVDSMDHMPLLKFTTFFNFSEPL